MNIYLIFISIWSLVNTSPTPSKSCSRENSRTVRDYFTQTLLPIYEKNHVSIPTECIFSSQRDIFYHQELKKMKISNEKWLCQYCNKIFYSEHYLDIHLSNRHNETLTQDEHSVCLADYCSIFRCEVLKSPKKSLNSFTRGFFGVRRPPRKIINEQQLTILRSRCASVVNECVPHNIKHDTRVKMQHEMYAEVCAYLTSSKYFELPNHYKPFLNITSVFCFTILIGMCFLIVGFVRRSDWRFNDDDDDESEKHLSEETISSATALLSKSPRNSIIHSSKSSSSSVRHRVHFASLDECNSLHTDPI